MTGSRKSTLLLVVAAIGVIATLTGCTPEDPKSTVTTMDSHSYSLPGHELRIKASEVRLHLKESSGSKVQVQRTAKGAATDTGNSQLTVSGNTLTIGVLCQGLVRSCEVDSTVSVPQGVRVTLTGSGAMVIADSLSGDLDLDVRNDGGIRVNKSSGTLRLYSGGGNITVAGARSADVRARATADASINLGFAVAPRRVEARASGSVRLTVPPGAETYRIDGSGVQGNLRSDPGSTRSISIAATDGVARADRKA